MIRGHRSVFDLVISLLRDEPITGREAVTAARPSQQRSRASPPAGGRRAGGAGKGAAQTGPETSRPTPCAFPGTNETERHLKNRKRAHLMSSITLIGTGNMARTLGTRAVAGGNTVEVMGRDQSKADDLAKALGGGATTGKWGAVPAGDIVITALLYDDVVPVVAEYGDALARKVIVDISNPFNATFDGLAHSEETSIAQEVAKVAPAGASVVKAFNTIFRNVLEKGRPDVFIAGDNAQAKGGVAVFIESLGLRPLDVGGLKMAHWLEGVGVVTVGLAGNGVGHWDFALGVNEFTG